MDYKEKYYALLEQARKELTACGSLDCDAARQIFRFFPELKENEDERITRAINNIQHFIPNEVYVINGVTKEDVLNWFEQKKELPFVKDVMLGYPAIYFYDGERMHFQGNPSMEERQKEQKPSTEETELNSIAFLEQMGYTCIPPGKEQQPAEWSEEDEEYLEEIIDDLNFCKKNRRSCRNGLIENCIDWLNNRLKSLRPQPHWKPSKEQMKTLKSLPGLLRNFKLDTSAQMLEVLYEQLQKL